MDDRELTMCGKCQKKKIIILVRRVLRSTNRKRTANSRTMRELRTGPQVSANDREKQKQKKRLSFKDPEIETPKKSGSLVGGSKQNQIGRNQGKELPKRKSETSGNDLSLEDQALQIAQSVGQAFCHTDVEVPNRQTSYLKPVCNVRNKSNAFPEQERNRKGQAEFEDVSYSRRSPLKNCKTTGKDQDYLDALTPTINEFTMRCPALETSNNVKAKNSIPSAAALESEKFPTGAQHQIQLLQYQLKQQGQQTQTAIHQVQLLKDQLDAESSARYKAQTQNHQLMVQNQELLDHIERLFKQIEDLEKNVETLEQDKRPTKIPLLQEPTAQSRWTAAAYGARRLSSDQAMLDKTPNTTRSQIATTRRSSLTTPITKPSTTQNKVPQLQSATTYRRSSITNTSLRPYSTIQTRSNEAVNKPTDSTLSIGDISPSPQKIANPFNSGWKSKIQGTGNQTVSDKNPTRTRNNSFSSSANLKPPELKQSLFGSCTSVGSPGVVSKKCSSTSDLYKKETSAFQASSKPLMIEEPSMSNSNDAGGSTLKSSSKLPHIKPYSSWQRSNTTVNDCDRVSVIGKDAFKNSPETSLLFNS